jgi:ribosomal protection tetracycline resistance protein
VYPVFFGSAITGAGVPALTEAIRQLLPAAADDTQAPASAAVFKVERGPAGEKIAYVRMFDGTLRTRDQTQAGKVTAVSVFRDGTAVRGDAARAGDIAKLWGLHTIRIGDIIGTARTSSEPSFSPPTLETVVTTSDKVALHNALTQLAEQDPLINLRQDGGEIRLSLYGEVQKEVIEATLSADFGLAVTFSDSRTICIERPSGTGHAVEYIKGDGNPFLAAIGLRVEPGSAGVDFQLEIEPGALPLAFLKAIEDTVRATLTQGIHGWEVTGCTVTLTHSGYYPRQSHAHARFDKSMSSTGADFRGLAPLVLMSALRQAGTRVCQPVQRLHLDIPAAAVTVVLPLLTLLDAVPSSQRITGDRCVIEGLVPAARTHRLAQRLPGLTSGEGVLECAFDHYEPVRGPAPARSRTDHNPLDRREYLLHIARRLLSQNGLCVTYRVSPTRDRGSSWHDYAIPAPLALLLPGKRFCPKALPGRKQSKGRAESLLPPAERCRTLYLSDRLKRSLNGGDGESAAGARYPRRPHRRRDPDAARGRLRRCQRPADRPAGGLQPGADLLSLRLGP